MLATREIDYRIVYMKESDFEKRVNEIYIAKQTHQRAPFFVDILVELVDIEAALFMIHHRDAFAEMSEREFDELYQRVEGEDTDSIQLVCERMDRNFVERFAKDLFLHLTNHQLAFMEQDVYDRGEWFIHNPSIQKVW